MYKVILFDDMEASKNAKGCTKVLTTTQKLGALHSLPMSGPGARIYTNGTLPYKFCRCGGPTNSPFIGRSCSEGCICAIKICSFNLTELDKVCTQRGYLKGVFY